MRNTRHSTILKNYYRDLKKLRRKLTFEEVYERVTDLETKLYAASIGQLPEDDISLDWFWSELETIRDLVIEKHHSIYLNEINSLINKVRLFGFHFATLDIRQDSRIHHRVFEGIAQKLIENGGTNLPKGWKGVNRRRTSPRGGDGDE